MVFYIKESHLFRLRIYLKIKLSLQKHRKFEREENKSLVFLIIFGFVFVF